MILDPVVPASKRPAPRPSFHTDGTNSAVVRDMRARNPPSYRRGALGNGARAASFRAATHRPNAGGQRALSVKRAA